MRVETYVEEDEIEADFGTAWGIIVTCRVCGHSVVAAGTSDGSRAYAGRQLRENCPRQENNFYVV